MRLGVYADLAYIRTEDGLSCDSSFARFLVELGKCAGELTVFGRSHQQATAGAIDLPAELVTFVELPGYRSLHNMITVSRSLRRAAAIVERGFSDLDAIFIFGPHPLSLLIARRAHRQRLPLFLGVRQHLPEYVRGRFTRILEPAIAAVAWTLEFAFRRVAAYAPTVVAGEDLAKRWRKRGKKILATSFSVIRTDELCASSLAGAQAWGTPINLLTVTRLDPEKNPLLFPKVIGELGDGWRLEIVGDGPLRGALRRRVTEADTSKAVTLAGPIMFGPTLLAEYRKADAFVHVSNTEGVPQVLFEAMAAGLPIVATDVGGVRAALRGGDCGLLVPPGDPVAVADALRRLKESPDLRQRLATAGRELVATQTLESQALGVFEFIAANCPSTI